MKIKFAYPLLLLLFTFLISACTAQPETAIVEPTPTPDPCTGWTCTLEGLATGESGDALAGITVNFEHASNCSPTDGEYTAITDEQGRFSFEVYLHDTDSFIFEVNEESYQSERVMFGGFGCLYCACEPLEIILQPAE